MSVGAGEFDGDPLGGCEDVKIDVNVVEVTVLVDDGAQVSSRKSLRPRRFFAFNGFSLFLLATANVQTINIRREENLDILDYDFVK